MTSASLETPRKRIVLLIEFDRFTLDAYKRALQDIAIVKQAYSTESAVGLIANEFQNGSILVLGGNQEHEEDLLMILRIAINQAQGNRFTPIIFTNTGNEALNRKLLDAGCTNESPTKKDLVEVLKNYGKSQHARENRALGFR